ARISSRDTIFLARFNANGTPDTTFDNDGTADGVLFVNNADCDTGPTAACDGESLSLVTSAGSVTAIYVGGESRVGDPGARLLRFTPTSGQIGFGPDTGYGTAGIVKIAPTRLVTDSALLLQPDGKVVLLGEVSVGGTTQCGAVRRLGDGT